MYEGPGFCSTSPPSRSKSVKSRFGLGGGGTMATPLAEKTAQERRASDGAEVSVGTRAVPQDDRLTD